VAANLLHVGSVNRFDVESIAIATLGAAAVLVVMQLVSDSGGLSRSWR
jgi:hypothetical protein